MAASLSMDFMKIDVYLVILLYRNDAKYDQNKAMEFDPKQDWVSLASYVILPQYKLIRWISSIPEYALDPDCASKIQPKLNLNNLFAYVEFS